MAHDGQDIAVDPKAEGSVILPDLLALTGAAVAPAEDMLAVAREKLRAQVSEDGRVSSKLVDAHQTAAHGFAWLATYVQVLRQMQAWAETGPALITLKYDYQPQDLEAANMAAACHASQFDEASRAGMMTLFDQSIWQGAVYFRHGLQARQSAADAHQAED